MTSKLKYYGALPWNIGIALPSSGYVGHILSSAAPPNGGSLPATKRWSNLMPILTWQLWLAQQDCTDHPLPWHSPQDLLSPGRVAQAFASILAAIGTPAPPPKPRGKSPGRATG